MNPYFQLLKLVSLLYVPLILFAISIPIAVHNHLQVYHRVSSIKAVATCPKLTPQMLYIKGGEFSMGAGSRYTEETPEHKASVNDFWISETEVTNSEFAEFIDATGYITVAERDFDPADFPDMDPRLLKAGSAVFTSPAETSRLSNMVAWWQFVEGANWRHPLGPESDIKGKEHYPVVHIAIEDAEAFAKWKGRRLPTEVEFEYAARGGLEGRAYAWGDSLAPGGDHRANTWQGLFPFQNSADDGFKGLAPVGCFEANGYGLKDMVGNVWEWTTSSYFPSHDVPASAPEQGYDPNQPGVAVGVIKGGSYLCSPSYCARYRPAARHPQDLTLGTNHIGFRTVSDQPPEVFSLLRN